MQKRTWVLPAILLFAAAVCAQGAGKGTISLTDEPIGYAGLGKYATSKGKTVSTKQELVSAVKSGGVIIINGMIDMSEGMLVAEGGKSTDSTPELDAFVKKQNKGYKTYAEWVNAYTAACKTSTEDMSGSKSGKSNLYDTLWAFNTKYRNTVTLSIQSNTTLVGAGSDCGIRGGRIQISSVENVQIRNLTIQDAYDPFPHHEKGDGYNAELDCVVIEGSKNVWVDRCTFEDTLEVGKVKTAGKTEEKWQTFDGLCDIKNKTSTKDETTNVTVSNCFFRNHDKTLLIGSSSKDGDNSKRFVTLYGNYFYNCGQRLPMVRNTTVHILNNYYDASNPHYANSYAVGVRENAIIYAENNYFGSGIKRSFDNSQGKLHSSGNTDNCTEKSKTTAPTDSKLFKDAVGKYTYTAMSASDAKTNAMNNAGAGYTLK